MRYCLLICLLFLLSISLESRAQQPLVLSLKDAILQAQKNSLEYKIALNQARSSYWNFNAYKAGFLPKLSLSGSLPDYYRSINMITLPSGENDFVSQNVANSRLNLNLNQNIPFTGGSLGISSSLQRIDNFGNFSNTAYTSVPVSLSYYQDNLFYNRFKWQKKIEPLKLEESEREYVERLENMAVATVDRYFSLLLADVQLKLDQQNLNNIDTLLKVTQARFEIGTATLNDVLQAKVSLLNARQSLSSSQQRLETSERVLVIYLNLDKDQSITLLSPDSIAFFDVQADMAVKEAQKNRKYTLESKRRILQAEEEVSRIKAETGPSVNLYANLGLTQTGSDLHHSYADLLRNQSVTLGFYIPLIDWGVNRSNKKRALANLDFEKASVSQMELTAEQEVVTSIMQWGTQREQMQISTEKSTLSQQRYDMLKQKYALGSISYTDFNNAQLDKDRAVNDYINNLRTYWSLYYNIRKITLFDFERQKKIELADLNFD